MGIPTNSSTPMVEQRMINTGKYVSVNKRKKEKVIIEVIPYKRRVPDHAATQPNPSPRVPLPIKTVLVAPKPSLNNNYQALQG